MKKHLQFIFLILIFISCKEKTSKQINTSESVVEQTVTKQVEWKSLVEKEIPHVSRFSAYDENGVFIAGLFDNKLKVVYLENDIDGILPFHEGYCIAIKTPENGTIMQISAIDNTGKKLFSYESDYIYELRYRNGYFGRSDGFDLNSNGQEVTTAEFHDGISITVVDGNLLGYKKENGSLLRNIKGEVIKENYCDQFFYNGFAVVGDNFRNLYGLINKNGKEILPKKYSYISKVDFGSVVASKRKTILHVYESPDYGLLSLNGDWIIEDKYYNFFQLSEDLVAVVEKPLDKCKYYETYEKSINFIPEIKIINLKSKEEKIIKENIVIDNYLYFKCFNDGVTVFFKPLDLKKIGFGLVNCDGKIVLNPEYDYIDYYPDNGYWQVKKDGKWYLFKEGEGLLDPLTYLDFSEVIK